MVPVRMVRKLVPLRSMVNCLAEILVCVPEELYPHQHDHLPELVITCFPEVLKSQRTMLHRYIYPTDSSSACMSVVHGN